MSALKIQVVSDFRDNASRGISRLNSRLGGLKKSSLGVAKSLGKIGAIGVGGAVASFGVLFGVTAKINGELTKTVDNLGKTAKVSGLTVAKLQEIQYITERTGGDVASLDKLFLTMNRTIGNLKAGTGQAFSALEKFDSSGALKNQLEASSDTATNYELILDKLLSMDDLAEKTALATAFFGARGADTIIKTLAEGEQGINKLKSQFGRFGGFSKTAINNAEKFRDTIANFDLRKAILSSKFLEHITPVFDRIITKVNQYYGKNKELINQKLDVYFKALGQVLEKSMVWVGGLIQQFDEFIIKNGGVEAVLSSFTEKLSNLFNFVMKHKGLLAGVFTGVALAPIVASLVVFGTTLAGIVTAIGAIPIAVGAAIAALLYGLYKVGKVINEIMGRDDRESIPDYIERTKAEESERRKNEPPEEIEDVIPKAPVYRTYKKRTPSQILDSATAEGAPRGRSNPFARKVQKPTATPAPDNYTLNLKVDTKNVTPQEVEGIVKRQFHKFKDDVSKSKRASMIDKATLT